MHPLNAYHSLSSQVYDLSKPTPSHDAYVFYGSFAREANGPILEPMCGSGRFLLPLTAEGFEVHGCDASPHMLQALRDKAAARGLTTHVWQAYLHDLNIKEKYHLVFIPSGSFGLITEPRDIHQSLVTLYKCLVPGGILVIELETSHAVPQPYGERRESQWSLDDGTTILLQQSATVEGSLCQAYGDYTLVEGPHILHQEHEEFAVRLYDDFAEFPHLLNQTGFQDIKCHKAFARHKEPDLHDAAIIYSCRR